MVWDVGGWAMPPVLDRLLDGIVTTFTSQFAGEIPLAQALQRETVLDYCRLATGRKVLITPAG